MRENKATRAEIYIAVAYAEQSPLVSTFELGLQSRTSSVHYVVGDGA